MENYFVELNNINVNDKVEKKNGLSYVSWAFAWGELKKHFPKSFYTVYENENGWPYFTDGRTCWVKTGVTVVQSEVVRDPTDGNLYGEDFGRLEHIEYLPIMDFRNNSIPADKVTSTDVNKAIQRSLTKAIARHGLGLYIYAGEDLPEAEKEEKTKPITDKEAMILSNTLTPEQIEWVRKKYKVKKLAELNTTQYGELMRTINDRENANGK
jgi:hypothetical protein